MATFLWGVPPGQQGDFDDENNWIDIATQQPGVPGAADTASTEATAHLVIAAGKTGTIGRLQALSQAKDEDVVRIDGALVVLDEVLFEDDRGSLRFTGSLSLDGT